MTWVYDDGGREAAGYRGSTGDCVTRAIAIASGLDYREVYRDLFDLKRERAEARGTTARSPRFGVSRRLYEPYLFDLGFTWQPLMKIGSGCTVHLTPEELAPFSSTLIARLSRHITAVIDGIIHDTYDPSRDGTRCVYGVYER
jgi:hypothetical protein